MELTHLMTVGWNLGNTFDSHWNGRAWKTINSPRDQETLWGNPVTSKAMIDKIKASGFNTVRIPVTWYIFTDPGPHYKINDAWMNRIQEVVDYVIGNGMFCILNTHHEDYQRGTGAQGDWECGWLRLYYTEGSDRQPVNTGRPLSDLEKAAIKGQLGKIWEQIAERFKNYDEHLIFEGLNEPRTIGFNNSNREAWAEQSGFLNELLQTFVDTVRAGGGKNPDRHLMVSPFFASIGMDTMDRDGRIGFFINRQTKKLFINDPRNRLIVSVHYYEPWGFVSAPSNSQWFSATFDITKGPVSSNINNVLKILEDNFVKNGIPVIMGETGAIHRDIAGHDAERAKWAEYYISKLKELGVPSVIWDDGGSFKLFDRSGLKWLYPDIAAALAKASQTPVKK
jgi:endoglucanase